MRKILAGGTAAGALVVGVAAGALLFGPAITTAASPSASPSTGTQVAPTGGDQGMPGGPGGRMTTEAVTDTSVAAKAIGISEADLTTAVNGGQTIAAVAKAHNVDPQKVIDALVADGQAELAAAVKAGTITQAQADAQKAEVTARATAQVNGTFTGHGPGGPGGPGGRMTTEAVTDTSVAAKAIGISEADLTTAVNGGQTIAAVAKAHNVDPQKVIDAFVADGQAELAAAVKAGTITQAQADAQKAEVTARATAQVNGTMPAH